MKRKAFILSIGLMSALAGFKAGAQANSSAAAEPLTVRVGYLTGPSRSFKAAYDNKQFDGKKYKLQLTEFAAGRDQFAAFAAGNLDVFFVGYDSGVAAIKNGLKIVYVSPWSHQVSRAYFLARADAGLTKTNLKGKKVAVGAGPFYHVHTQKWLESLGYTASVEPGKADVQIVKVAEATLPSALRNGDVDFVYTWDRINAYQWINDFKFKFVQGAEDGAKVADFLNPYPPAGGWWVSPEFLQKNPDFIREFDRDSRKAASWFFKLNPEEQRNIYVQAGGKNFSALSRTVDKSTYDSLISLRESPVNVDEKFDLAVISEWVDFVAAIVGGVPSSKDVDLRTTIAPHLLK